ncbi:helix-turn-helix transcriptional regulator [Rhizobium lentis]|uniref:Transcriptional regulator with XRE-family HTH domain n=1 Tax=Rhizobium lentis TaxID=1138194 RepID=A0A7W8UMC3_9HYPH|nr:helix-turn-helix transcriptional regulator [Rhizobium lentis]MBB4574421.1 transcriptional regulator with XRE-family HTH domain [Rhizobium lentis]MBB5550347.1 transcriptional regulator with XRE-family HTH domain [Rhizobium lentis]MBB5560624.1 transcriptional regulator with XRE-family HTH domain [Rhizobium lentis]MBB5567209.1 transcriptional regulator with XRE-family HTH domain [Rhizobium lentis]
MNNVAHIHTDKTPVRVHFIVEWAEKRNLKQSDIVREIGADKGLVSRWFGGTVPKPEYLEKLAALFGTDIHGIFRHPDDDWLAQFFKDKSAEQRERAIDMLRLLFNENKTGTNN